MTHLTCNGRPVDVALLTSALVNYGHFTSMQVRAGAVQGLHLHLERLVQGTEALFGTALDPDTVRGWMRDALMSSGLVDASLRVTVFSRHFDFRTPLAAVEADVLVAVSAPVDLPPLPRRVRSTTYARELPQIKHVGTFGLFEQRRQALLAGFDDALFVTRDGLVSEGTTWNLALLQGNDVVWPCAPALRGVAERLLQDALGPARIRPVTLQDLGDCTGAFACNATGIWPLAAIDGHVLPESGAFCQRARQALAQVAGESLAAGQGAGRTRTWNGGEPPL